MYYIYIYIYIYLFIYSFIFALRTAPGRARTTPPPWSRPASEGSRATSRPRLTKLLACNEAVQKCARPGFYHASLSTTAFQ